MVGMGSTRLNAQQVSTCWTTRAKKFVDQQLLYFSRVSLYWSDYVLVDPTNGKKRNSLEHLF